MFKNITQRVLTKAELYIATKMIESHTKNRYNVEVIPIKPGDPISDILDRHCSIDALVKITHPRKPKKPAWIGGVSIRTQPIRDGYKPYDTFTIRSSTVTEYDGATEADKLAYATSQKRSPLPIYSTWMIQIYTHGNMATAGISTMSAIQAAISKDLCSQIKPKGQEEFFVIRWQDVEDMTKSTIKVEV